MSNFQQPIVSEYFPLRLCPNNLFTKEEKKRAKRDYKELKQRNPAGFNNSLKQFRVNFANKMAKFNLRFNLKNIDELKN